MSLWDQYAPQYGFVLLLVFWLVLRAYYRRRREWRLVWGWRLEKNKSGVVEALDEISTFLFGAMVGAELAARYHVASAIFLILWLVISLLTPREKWVPPLALPGEGANSGEANES